MVVRTAIILFCLGASFATAQTPGSGEHVLPESPKPNPDYVAPTDGQLFHDFVFDTVGPYPLAMGLFTAGIHQATDNPPEWEQGASGYAKRLGSNMGITGVGNATRFGLSKVLNEDTRYYRCRCSGIAQRLSHAVFSTAIARSRADGSSTFSVAGLAAPYAATFTATYAWYPDRYGAKDAFRMGNYNLMGTAASNLVYEFLPKKVNRFLVKFHLSSERISR